MPLKGHYKPVTNTASPSVCLPVCLSLWHTHTLSLSGYHQCNGKQIGALLSPSLISPLHAQLEWHVYVLPAFCVRFTVDIFYPSKGCSVITTRRRTTTTNLLIRSVHPRAFRPGELFFEGYSFLFLHLPFFFSLVTKNDKLVIPSAYTHFKQNPFCVKGNMTYSKNMEIRSRVIELTAVKMPRCHPFDTDRG